MKNTTRILIVLLAVLGLLTSPFGAAAGANTQVTSAGNIFTVYPTGLDDTENISKPSPWPKPPGRAAPYNWQRGTSKFAWSRFGTLTAISKALGKA